MPPPSDKNALYQEWLEIPEERLPPNHYAILGVDDFESDPQIIEDAAKSRGAYLHQIAAGPQRKIVQEMLGQVAIARRTLLNDQACSDYNLSLQNDSTEHGANVAVAASSGSASVDRATGKIDPHAARKKSTRRKKPSDWKYHAISAGVFLLIVGVIYWVNRNPGGRRAADAQSFDTSSLDRSSSAGATESTRVAKPKAASVQARETRRANARKAPAIRSRTPASPRTSTIAKRRSTGSGLGMGLDSKFADVLTDIAKQPSENIAPQTNSSDSPQTLQSKGRLLISPVKNSVNIAEWPSGLVAVAEFPSKAAERFECERGFDWHQVADNQLQIKTDMGKNLYRLTDNQFKMTGGSAVAVTTSLAAKMPSETSLTFSVDGIRIGLRPTKIGVELYALNRDSNGPIESICKIKTKKPATLTIVRDDKIGHRLRWFIKTGATARTGTIDAPSLSEAASVSLSIATPQKELKQTFWLSDYKTRSGSD